MTDRLQNKVAIVFGAGSIGPRGVTARRQPPCSPPTAQMSSASTSTGLPPRRRRTSSPARAAGPRLMPVTSLTRPPFPISSPALCGSMAASTCCTTMSATPRWAARSSSTRLPGSAPSTSTSRAASLPASKCCRTCWSGNPARSSTSRRSPRSGTRAIPMPPTTPPRRR
jgi:hypothetical protein